MAGLTSKYWFEKFAKLPVSIEVASEFRYGEVPMAPSGLSLVVSSVRRDRRHAGLTALLQSGGAKAAVDRQTSPPSTMARESDVVAPTLAGPEIGVASTKAFTCQLAVLACLALALGRARGVLSEADEARLVGELIAVPGLMAEAMKREPAIEHLAREFTRVRDVLYLGRGTLVPAGHGGRLEAQGAVLHPRRGLRRGRAEARPYRVDRRGHARHRHRAGRMPSTKRPSPTCRRSRRAAAGSSCWATAASPRIFAAEAEAIVTLPDMAPAFTAMVYAVPVQMIAYHTAVAMGKDADQPRNLAEERDGGVERLAKRIVLFDEG